MASFPGIASQSRTSVSRPTGLLPINDFHVSINGAYTMRGRAVRFLVPFQFFPSVEAVDENARYFFFLSFLLLSRTRVFPARGGRATKAGEIVIRGAGGGGEKEGGGRWLHRVLADIKRSV